MTKPRVLVAGGGYIGVYSALEIQKAMRGRVELTVVAPESYMVYQPFLPEAAAGNIEPRHVVVPLRSVLKHARFLNGRVEAIDPDAQTATVVPVQGDAYELAYDHVVVGLGSVSRVLPVPGLADNAVGFKTVAEAIYLRNQVLARMDAAESTTDGRVRQRALTFTFVGGGYAGVEALAELEDLARYACRLYPSIERSDMRWVLVEAANGILPEIGEGLAAYALERLRARDIEVHLDTRLESATGGTMRLSNGEEFASDTLVWTAGVKAHPVTARTGFPTDDRGRILVDATMRVEGRDTAWAAGDCAAVPDLTTGGICPPTAQHAVRQGRLLGKNVVASLRGGRVKPFKYKNMGGIVSLGRYKGVARALIFNIRGFPAWWLHRTYHVTRVPTFNRKARIIVDWTVALFFRRDVVQLASLSRPKDPMTEALGHTSEATANDR